MNSVDGLILQNGILGRYNAIGSMSLAATPLSIGP